MKIMNTATEMQEMFEKVLGEKIETDKYIGNMNAYFDLAEYCLYELSNDVRYNHYEDIKRSSVYGIVKYICSMVGYEVDKTCKPEDILKYYEDEENKKKKMERN